MRYKIPAILLAATLVFLANLACVANEGDFDTGHFATFYVKRISRVKSEIITISKRPGGPAGLSFTGDDVILNLRQEIKAKNSALAGWR